MAAGRVQDRRCVLGGARPGPGRGHARARHRHRWHGAQGRAGRLRAGMRARCCCGRSHAPVAVGATELVGQVVPPYPEGLRSTDRQLRLRCGRLCSTSATATIETLADADGLRRWVVAGRRAGDEGPTASAQDHRCHRASAHRRRFRPGKQGTCRLDGVGDDHVVAVVRHRCRSRNSGATPPGHDGWTSAPASWSNSIPARVDCLAIGD